MVQRKQRDERLASLRAEYDAAFARLRYARNTGEDTFEAHEAYLRARNEFACYLLGKSRPEKENLLALEQVCC